MEGEAEPDSDAEDEAESEPEPDAEAEAESKPEPDAKPDVEAQAESESDADVEPKTVADAERFEAPSGDSALGSEFESILDPQPEPVEPSLKTSEEELPEGVEHRFIDDDLDLENIDQLILRRRARSLERG